MSSVNDLFAKRKKKGKAKKSFNANKALKKATEEEDTSETAPKMTNEQSIKAKGKTKDALATGDWVDDSENKSRQHATMTLGLKLGELDSAPHALQEHEHVEVEEQQETQTLFHQSRQQAMSKPTEPKPAEEPAKGLAAGGGWRARMAARENFKGESKEVLKHLDNDRVFPSLGGSAAKSSQASATAGAWGTVLDVGPAASVGPKQDVSREECFIGNYLEASTFEGAKPGYMFTTNNMGTGYYWEGPEEVVEETAAVKQPAAIVEDPAPAQEEPTPAPTPEPAPAPALDAASASAPAPAPEIEKTRAAAAPAKEKKKKKTSKPETMPSVDPDPVAASPTPAAEPEAPPPPPDTSRFAGLKKKKKKKKAAA